MVYVHLLYEQLVKERKLTPDNLLPPIFPLLLYNGNTKWKAATNIKSLISLPDNTSLWKYQPNMRYYLVDESQYPKGKSGSLSGLIFQLENANNSQEFLAALENIIRDTEHLSSLKRAISVWITYVIAPHKGIKLSPQNADNLNEVKNMLSAKIEQWEIDKLQEGMEKGIKKGIEKGIEKGMEKGREEGRRTTILQAHKAGISIEEISTMFEIELDVVKNTIKHKN